MTKFSTDQIPELKGSHVLVTGANSGLGYQTSLELAKKGAKVWLATRDQEKAKAALDQLLKEVPNGDFLTEGSLDLSSLKSVKEFAALVKSKWDHIDLLINNAGVMGVPERKETKDGFELQFGTNHLGHFALTGLLLPLLVKSKKARVVTVSSIYHKPGKINFDDLHFKKSYKPYDAYAASKLANLLFTKELQRLFDQKGITNVISVGAHPGYTATNLQSSGPAMPQWFINPLNACFGMRLEKGALSQIYAAVSEEVEKGGYYGPDGFYEIWGYPGRAQEAPAANDQETAKKLWEVSEQLTGVKYQL